MDNKNYMIQIRRFKKKLSIILHSNFGIKFTVLLIANKKNNIISRQCCNYLDDIILSIIIFR